MKQVITWLGKPVKLICPAGNALPRLGGTRGRFWLFTMADRDDIDGFAQEQDLLITIEEDVCRNCGQKIESDPVNSWVHNDSGFAGCGLPFHDVELYAEPIGGLNVIPE